MKTLVLLDIDGTLLDAQGEGKQGFYEVLERLFPGVAFPEIDMAGRTDLGIWEQLLSHLPSPPLAPGFARFAQEYGAVLESRLKANPPREIPGAIDFLASLDRHADLVPCLVTGNFRDGARHKLDALGCWELFETAGGWGTWGDQVTTKKVLAKRLLESWWQRHPGPVRAVFLGDTLADLECATHAGVPCVVVNGNRPAPEFAAAGAVAVWRDFLEPDNPAEHLRQLSQMLQHLP